MTLGATRLIVGGEGPLAVVAGPAELPLVHCRHRQLPRGPLPQLEDLDVARVTFGVCVEVLLMAEGDRSRASLPQLEGEVGRHLRLLPGQGRSQD